MALVGVTIEKRPNWVTPAPNSLDCRAEGPSPEQPHGDQAEYERVSWGTNKKEEEVQKVHQESWDLNKKLNKFTLGEGSIAKNNAASAILLRSLRIPASSANVGFTGPLHPSRSTYNIASIL